MNLAVLIVVFSVLLSIDLSWSLGFPLQGVGAPPNINADANADANSAQDYFAVLDGVRGAIEELIAKHDSLLKENKGEEAAMLREQLVSLHIPLYRLQFNGAVPPQFSDSTGGAEGAPPPGFGPPGFGPPGFGPPGFGPPGFGPPVDPDAFGAPNAEYPSSGDYRMPEFPPDMPDALRKQVQDSMRSRMGRMEGKYPSDLSKFSAAGSRDKMNEASFAALSAASGGQRKFTPPPPMNDFGSSRARISSSLSPSDSESVSRDPARNARVDKFLQILRQRVDDMQKRVDVNKRHAATAAVDVAQLKLDIEKYYLAEVSLISMMEDDAARVFQMSQPRQGRVDPLEASKLTKGISSMDSFDASRLKHGALSSDPFIASKQRLMQPGAFQDREMINNELMEKREEVRVSRDDVMKRIQSLESGSR